MMANSTIKKDSAGNRMSRVLEILRESYPKATIALTTWKTPWELLVAVVLSAQCTDVMVNKVTEKLFQKYKTIDDYLGADLKTFEKDIKSTGFYHNKAKNILAAASMIKTTYGGKVPKTMDELIALPGVARKTANIILWNAYEVTAGVAVDTHVSRISQRLRLVHIDEIGGKQTSVFTKRGKTIIDFKKDADAAKIEQQLMRVFPKNDWSTMSYKIQNHGRTICKAQNPNCAQCPLSSLCPASRVS